MNACLDPDWNGCDIKSMNPKDCCSFARCRSAKSLNKTLFHFVFLFFWIFTKKKVKKLRTAKSCSSAAVKPCCFLTPFTISFSKKNHQSLVFSNFSVFLFMFFLCYSLWKNKIWKSWPPWQSTFHHWKRRADWLSDSFKLERGWERQQLCVATELLCREKKGTNCAKMKNSEIRTEQIVFWGKIYDKWYWYSLYKLGTNETLFLQLPNQIYLVQYQIFSSFFNYHGTFFVQICS